MLIYVVFLLLDVVYIFSNKKKIDKDLDDQYALGNSPLHKKTSHFI